MAVYHGKNARFYRASPVDACAQARCDYCGRYGTLGSCEGCGAPNRPVVVVAPQDVEYIDVTVFGDAKPRFITIPARQPDRFLR